MGDKARFMLSTTDNPYSPFTDWVPWLMEDIRLGHNTCGLLARMTAGAESINDESEVIGMYDVVRNNFSGVHLVVVPEDYSSH